MVWMEIRLVRMQIFQNFWCQFVIWLISVSLSWVVMGRRCASFCSYPWNKLHLMSWLINVWNKVNIYIFRRFIIQQQWINWLKLNQIYEIETVCKTHLRYLYIFVWRNVGHLNDEFFGVFTAVANIILAVYFAAASVMNPGARGAHAFMICYCGDMEEEGKDGFRDALQTTGEMT